MPEPIARRNRLPVQGWGIVTGAAITAIGAVLPWYDPSGQISADEQITHGPIAGWQLTGAGFLGAIALLVVGLVCAITLIVQSRSRRLPGLARPRQVIGWAALIAVLVTLFGTYIDWRAVPEAAGIGAERWQSAVVSGFSVSSGAQPGVWLVVTGAVIALLSAAVVLRILIRVIGLTYLGGLVLLPVFTVVRRTFESGARNVWDVITTDADFLAAVRLTAEVAGIAVVLNTIFGLGISLLLVRYRFPGRRLLNTLIDLPLAISPVVVGVALVLVFGQNGWFGKQLQDIGFQVIFAKPGMILATIIVAMPLVVREVIPVLEEAGLDQEQAAQSLGANSWQRLTRITLPTIKWALAYGVVLSLARSIGEFGAVRVVSQSVAQESQTVTLFVNREYEQLGPAHKDAAFIGSFVLMVVAVLCMVVISLLRPKDES